MSLFACNMFSLKKIILLLNFCKKNNKRKDYNTEHFLKEVSTSWRQLRRHCLLNDQNLQVVQDWCAAKTTLIIHWYRHIMAKSAHTVWNFVAFHTALPCTLSWINWMITKLRHWKMECLVWNMLHCCVIVTFLKGRHTSSQQSCLTRQTNKWCSRCQARVGSANWYFCWLIYLTHIRIMFCII